ncbi:SusD family protein [Bacteroidales bacterium KA00344]|nr:SusD family protein [Bacteroidales bacterium KA00344]
MKNIFNLLLCSLTLVATFGSCDINDVENYTEMSTENFPVTESDANAVLAGIYECLNAPLENADTKTSWLLYADLASDDQLGGGGLNDAWSQSYDFLCNVGQNQTNAFWKHRYTGINRANTLIAALPNLTTISDEDKVMYKGEALVLRGLYYYELASMYGNVPLVTVPSGSVVTPGDVKVLWGQILQDFYIAATTMPSKRRTDGHVDKYVAEALLARAFLFYTGFYCNGETISDLTSTTYNPLQEVALPNGISLTKGMVCDLIDDCINNSGYSLVSDYRELWAYTNRFTVEDYDYTKGQNLKWAENDNAVNPESMMAIKFNKLAQWPVTGYANGLALYEGVRGAQKYANTFPFGMGWGCGPVAPNLVSDWISTEPDDPRLEASIQDVRKLPKYKYGGYDDYVQETDYYAKKKAPISAKNDGSQGEKYPVSKVPYFCCFENLMYGTDGWIKGANYYQLNNIHDLVLMRFADVLLMQSELQESISGINKVRARAGLRPIAKYSLEALQNERRHELAFEGTRWNDIRRWHIAASALERQTNQPIYLAGKADKNTAHNGGYAERYNATAGFAKMPDSQVSIGSVPQNAGYSDASSEYTGW